MERNFVMQLNSHLNIRFTILVATILLSTVFSNSVLAQKKSIRFQHFTTDDGLPQNMVDCILEDSKGFMWFGTWNGLCRFDGYTFKKINGETSNGTSLNNFVYALSEDQFGNIWIGTEVGLSVFINNKGKLKNFSKRNYKNRPIILKGITAMTGFDSGKIWVAGKEGITEYKVVNDTAKIGLLNHYSFGQEKNEVAGKEVNALLKDKVGNLWIGTNQGISLLKKGKNKFERIVAQPGEENSLPSNVVQEIFEDSNGAIWIGTDNGVSVYNQKTGSFNNYFHSPFDEFSLVHNSITSFLEDFHGNIIVGTLGGLSILEKKAQNTFTNYYYKSNSEYELNNDFINCLYKDKRGNIWIGTERGGINKYNSKQKVFEYFEKEANNPNSLSNNTVNSILEDDKFIWIGTAGGGLNQFAKETKTFKYLKNVASDPSSLSSNFVTSLSKNESPALWIGTWGGGLSKLDVASNRISRNYRQGTGNNLINDFISSLLFGPDHKLWIGTREGLDCYDPKTETFEHFNVEIEGKTISQVGCLAFDDKNNLWVGTETGLFKINANDNGQIDVNKAKVKYFKHSGNRSQSLSGNYVVSLLFDSKGKLWVGTYGKGLNLLVSEQNEGTFRHFTGKDGLANEIVYTILEDDNGAIWLTTDNGLSRYKPKKNEFRNFYTTDGLQNNQYYWSAAYKNSNGKLYFGGMNGLNAFHPQWLAKTSYQPKVVFTDFKVFNESVEIGEKYGGHVVLSNAISDTKEIEISYKSNEFQFEFSALDFGQSNLNEYAYKLVGFDKDWNYIGSKRRFASYTNLKPDKYIFKVKTTNSNGEWTEPPTSITITIVPPFWQTAWFKIAMVAFAIALVISYNRYRVYSLRMQKRRLELQVAERTLEIKKQNNQLEEQNKQLASKNELIEGQKLRLEKQNEEILAQRDNLIELNKKVKLVNQYKLKFFTNVSHEFRTPLTLILGPIEKLLKEKGFDEKTKNSLNLINRNAQRLLQLINQLMDFRKVEKGKMELQISKTIPSKFISGITDAFKELAKQKEISFTIDVKNIPNEAWLDYDKIENILYNLLSNAFKYTQKSGSVVLKAYLKNAPECPEIVQSTTIEPAGQTLVFEVTDTGRGIKEESLKHIFNRFFRGNVQNKDVEGSGIGLALTKEMIKVHQGAIKVTSKYGKGSSFYIVLPISKEAYNEKVISDKVYNGENIQKQVDNLYHQFIEENKFKEFTNNKKLKTLKNRPTVLIAEDNDDLRDFLAVKLNDDYNILEAENGKIAFDMALVKDPSLIISDIMMPKMDGIELCNAIKENIATSHIPVILLTAKSNIESRLEGFQSGADDYLSKPFNLSLLEARISNLIESRRKLLSGYSSKLDIEPKDITSTKIDEQFLKDAIELVDKNIHNAKFGVPDLIAGLNMSRSSLHRKFVALTNQSAVDFINGVKLKKSIELLKTSDMNISEIAYSVGFNDPKYYSRIFKKTFGKAPSEYQKKITEL